MSDRYETALYRALPCEQCGGYAEGNTCCDYDLELNPQSTTAMLLAYFERPWSVTAQRYLVHRLVMLLRVHGISICDLDTTDLITRPRTARGRHG